jgi:hypothetical protein
VLLRRTEAEGVADAMIEARCISEAERIAVSITTVFETIFMLR